MNTSTKQRTAEATLTAGLRWLFDTEQPEGAVLQHHGVVLPGGDTRRFGFCPAGWAGRAIVTVDVVDVQWKFQRGHKVPANPLRPDELDDLTAQLAALGADVVNTWNGHPGITGSLALARPAHPSLLAAVNRYRAGCLTRPGPGSDTGVFCKCGWYAKGYALVIQPGLRRDCTSQQAEPR
jgi:hypothetical protein